MQKSETYKWAETYVELGLPVIPICSHDHGGEDLKHREVCQYSGKVPVIMNWQNRTSTEEEELRRWFAAHPKRNVGVPTGNASRLVGIDIDGDYGEAFLEELSGGELPDTWEFSTGKGRRLLYELPPGLRVKKFKKVEQGRPHEEVALLGDGQQTVLPPSIHKTGRVYQWREGRSPLDGYAAPAPKWMLDLMQASIQKGANGETGVLNADGYIDLEGVSEQAAWKPTVSADEWSGMVPEGQRQDRLKKLAGSLIGRGNIPTPEILTFLRAWNHQHCSPPWPDSELVTLVTNLTHSEESKKSSRKKRGSGGAEGDQLRPTPFAKAFLAAEHSRGYGWCYCVENGQFYRCNMVSGPWQPLDPQYLNALVRDALIAANEDWDSSGKVSEVCSAMRDQLSNPEISARLGGSSHEVGLRLICTKNGLLDWRSGDLLPWDATTYLTTQVEANYNPAAKCPTWLAALEEWVPDAGTRAFLQEFVGLCLIPDTAYRAAVFLYGAGSNGKSMFIDTVSKLLGSTSCSFMPLHSLAERFDIAYLQNKLLNVCGDIDPQYLKETGTLKAIIAGDRVKGEFKHGKSFYFTPVAKLIFSANELPKTRDKSEGWYSRWSFINFPNNFARNADYKIKFETAMASEEERSGLLNWAVEGLRRLKGENSFSLSESMVQAKHEYTIENDSVYAFIEDRCMRVALRGELTSMEKHTVMEKQGITSSYVNKTDLYEYYKHYCSEMGLKAVSSRDMTRLMLGYGFPTQARPKRTNRKESANSFLGIYIQKEFEADFNFVVNCAFPVAHGY